jgi:hypothetical protein
MGPEYVSAPRGSVKPEALDLDGCQPITTPISREVLLAMSRGKLRIYLTAENDDETAFVFRVRCLWSALLTTMRGSSIADSQMTAVCNATCVFLQSASSSPVQSIQKFAMSGETWMAAFDTLLDKFDASKLKPLRQVLNTLMKILKHHEDRSTANFIQDCVLSKMASIMLLGRPVPRLKASMVIFEAFIRSGIPLSKILSAIGRSHGSNIDKWHQRLTQRGFDNMELRAIVSTCDVDESLCHFSFSILLAVVDSGAQATAGTFLNNLILTLTGHEISLDSLVVELVMIVLHHHPQAVEAFKNYFLASFFKIYPYHCFDLLFRVVSAALEPSALEAALTIAILGCSAGFVSEKGMPSPTEL